jgi:hypothetical protein
LAENVKLATLQVPNAKLAPLQASVKVAALVKLSYLNYL